MTTQVSDANSARRFSLSQKLALVGGAVAAITGIAPQSADATPIQSTTLPLSPPATGFSLSGGTSWDVDGDGTPDFHLRNCSSFCASVTELGLARFVAPRSWASDGFAKLAAGFNVGATMTGGFKFLNNAQSANTITTSGLIGSDAGAQGWAMGDLGYFGFKFTNVSGVHYGWGQINIHGATGGFVIGQGFTLTEAYYNSVADAAIAVAVPEPTAGMLALVMGPLALLKRRRMRRSKAAEGDATVSA